MIRGCSCGLNLLLVSFTFVQRYCYDLNRRAIVNLRDCLECSRIYRDGNVRYGDFHDLLPVVLSVPGESQGDSAFNLYIAFRIYNLFDC
jgi:hypothetical protein